MNAFFCARAAMLVATAYAAAFSGGAFMQKIARGKNNSVVVSQHP